jgi:hypothetical protein
VRRQEQGDLAGHRWIIRTSLSEEAVALGRRYGERTMKQVIRC